MTTHSLPRHGADPERDATEAIVRAGYTVKVDCNPDAAATFLTGLKADVEDPGNTEQILIVLPVLKDDDSKGFVKGQITRRDLFNHDEGTFRMKVSDGFVGWFDITLDVSKGTYKVKRVKERVARS